MRLPVDFHGFVILGANVVHEAEAEEGASIAVAVPLVFTHEEQEFLAVGLLLDKPFNIDELNTEIFFVTLNKSDKDYRAQSQHSEAHDSVRR